jgi:DNA-directed RNA polymerase subunit RPC12/RpoP
MPNGNKVDLGRNIIYGLLFFLILALSTGFGTFISIVASSEENALFGLLGSLMVISAGPILALIIGIIQGKMARSEGEALIAGGVTGVVGYILVLFIVMGLLFLALAIKFPSEGDGDTDVSVEFGEMLVQWIALLLPSGIIGAMSAYLSSKFVFGEPSPFFPPPGGPTYQRLPQYQQRGFQQPVQQEPQLDIYDCPHCGNALKTVTPDRPKKILCPSCGGQVIVGL